MKGDLPLPNRLEDFPKRLQEIRERLGWSQSELAKKVGIARSTLACIEMGHRKPSAEVLWNLLAICSNGHSKKSE